MAQTPQYGDSEHNLLLKIAENFGVVANSGDSKNSILYKIANRTYQSAINPPSPSYDPDALAYVQASGATDIDNINAFVVGVKALGLWNSMVCWPLRSSQNAGTGSIVYSLGGLGTYNGTLVNGPTWGADGITFAAASSQRISTNLSFVSYPLVAFAITKVTSIPTVSSTSIIDNDTGLHPNRNWALGFQNFGGNQNSAYAFSTTANNGLTPAYTLSANFDSHIYNLNSSTHALSKNGTQIASSNIGFTLNTSATPKVFIGSRSDGARGFNGPIALAGLISGTVSNSVFNDLLKSTLGQGLGLP
jgi:hypothetical protein